MLIYDFNSYIRMPFEANFTVLLFSLAMRSASAYASAVRVSGLFS